jgi:ABC-2 type transport system permease protein
MNFIWLSAKKDLLRLWREPAALAAWIGIPVFVGLLLALMFGGGEVKPHGTLLIADEDDSFLSRVLPSAFSQDKLGEMFTVEKVSQAEGRVRLGEGRASALVIIPKGFSSAVRNGTPSTLTVVRNPAQQILPEIVEQTVRLLAEAGFYVHALAGEELKSFTGSRPSDAAIAVLSVRMAHSGDGIAAWLFPPRITVETRIPDQKQSLPSAGFASLLFPGMLFMGLLFTASGISGDWWKEKQQATFRRTLATPAGSAAVLAGKLLAYSLLAAAVTALGLLLGRLLIDMPLPRPGWTVLWSVLSASSAYLAFLLLQTLATQRRVADILANLILMPLCMIGGCFFPFEAMPAGLASIGKLTPNGMAIIVLRQTLDPAAKGPWWIPAAAGAAVLVFLFALCVPRLRARFVF